MRLLLGLTVGLFVLGACGGKTTDESDLVISDNESALGAPEESGGGEESARGDDGCRDGDRDGHKHHRHHWFKVLDLLDGTRDKQIDLSKLPDGMPERLVRKLTRIDRNGDGIVTKKEVKHWLRHRDRDCNCEHENEDRDDD